MPDPIKRPSLRDAARRGAEASRREREARAAQQAPPAAVGKHTDDLSVPPPPGGEGPAAPRVEQVAARCGHAVPFELYPDGRDKWRESRRKQITDRDCPECRKKAHDERQAAEMEAARQRRGAKPKAEGAPPATRNPATGRLPDGANFNVTYDAQAERWTGTLTVPTAGADPAVFTASAGGVFQLLRELDRLFRGGAEGGPAPPPADRRIDMGTRADDVKHLGGAAHRRA